MLDGLRLAASTFTVVPVPAGRVDRTAAGAAMSVAPAMGAALGSVAGTVLIGLSAAGAPPLVAGGVAVAVAALLTRGLHLDGLADTADGLGAYRTAEAALRVMKQPDVGPFGVVALVLALLLQAGALAGLAGQGWMAVLATTVTAMAAGRLAATWACRRGVPSARPDGLGALVAGTVGRASLAVATAAVVVVAVPAVPGRPWQGPVAVVGALAVALLFVRHAVRRFGGITGDVLGAVIEITTTLGYLGLALRPALP